MGHAAALLLSSASHSIFIFVLTVLIVPQVLLCEGDDDVGYTECHRSFNCGTVTDITYPFWGDGRPQFCGLEGFKVECYEDKYPIHEYQEQKYRVLKIDRHLRTMRIARTDLMNGTCLREFRNTSMMDSTLFYMTPAVKSLSIFYGCYGTSKNISNEFECLYDGSRKSAFFMEGIFLSREFPFNITTCITSIKVPVLQSALDAIGEGNIGLQEALNRGFDVQYSDQPECSACTSSGGLCSSNSSSPPSSFTCYCRDKPHARTCNHPGTFFKLAYPGDHSRLSSGGFFFYIGRVEYARKSLDLELLAELVSVNTSKIMWPIDRENLSGENSIRLNGICLFLVLETAWPAILHERERGFG